MRAQSVWFFGKAADWLGALRGYPVMGGTRDADFARYMQAESISAVNAASSASATLLTASTGRAGIPVYR